MSEVYPSCVTTNFLSLLLKQIQKVYLDNTDDFVAIYALRIAIEAINADEKIRSETAEHIADEMAMLANCMLSENAGLTSAVRERLAKISKSNSKSAEPATAIADHYPPTPL